jgi:hypothetical protein
MAATTALQLVKSAALRLGMTAPESLPYSSGQSTTIEDKDALLLLGALNAAVKNITYTYSWRELIRQAVFSPNYYDVSSIIIDEDGKIVPPPTPPATLATGQRFLGWDINEMCVGFDGIVSNCLLFPQKHMRIPLLTYDKFLYMSEDKGFDPIFETIEQNGYIITNNLLELVHRYGEGIQPYSSPKVYFYYKTKFPVVRQNGQLWNDESIQLYFVSNDDWSPIDDEVLILGTIINYKNYIGRDFQLEFKQYNDYIEHMKERTGGVTIIEESMYNEMSNVFHRYPPVGQGGNASKPQQGNQPQQQNNQNK